MLNPDVFEAAREEVAFAFENVRFFRRHMESAGLRPSDLRDPEQFRRLPTTRKLHYRKNFPAGVIARGKSIHGRLIWKSTSSGTGGERLITVAHTHTLARIMRHTISVHPAFSDYLLSVPGRRTVRYAAPNCSDVECAAPHSTPADRTLADGTLVLPVYHDLLATPETKIQQAIDEMAWYQPHWLYIDPTHLAFLIRHMRARDLPPPDVGAIALTYTQCTAVARRQVEEFFPPDIPMGDVISMSELGWVVMECPLRTHHLNTSTFYAELLVDDRPAEPGELAELVMTSLGDRLCPHIRYRTGDYYRLLAEPCACGHAHAPVRHEGRLRDFLVRRGRLTLTPRTLDDLIGAAPWMDLYKMEQIDDDHFIFRYMANERYEPGVAEELERRLKGALGDGASLRFERTHYISGDRSGKFVSCISSLSAEGESI